MSQRIYLDHAATTPMLPTAIEAVREGQKHWANASSPHTEGRAARAALEGARARVAAAYGWRCETIFTSGTSEALAIVLARSVASRRLIGATEHDAVIRAAGDAAMLPVDGNGMVDLHALEAALTGEGRALVAVQWANSETGVLQPLSEIATRVHAVGGLLLVDAAQAPPGTGVEGADFVALSSHKRGGPAGIGALLVRDLATLEPSGGQERGYRSGTENVPGALGFAAALAETADVGHWSAMRARLDDAVSRSGGEVIAGNVARHPAIASYHMPGVESAVQLIRFDMAGIAVSAGSACASGSMKPSHVLTAMGWGETAAREVVRISFGTSTTDSDVDAAIAAWRAIARDTRRAVA